MMLTGLADWIRLAGLRCEEAAGWQTRGHGEVRDDKQNIVVVDHHTAGSPLGRAGSLSTCLYGVPGVPGPLANVLQTREPDGNDVFIVIAAGVSYNAGSGGFAGVSGNRSTVGIECEHTGVVTYPAHRASLTQRFNAAVLKGLGHPDGSRSCQHSEWSTAGKIDIATGVDRDAWRAATTQFMRGGPLPAPDQEDEMQRDWFATSPWDPTQLQVWWFTQAGHCYVPPSSWTVIQTDAALNGKPVPKPYKGTPEMFNQSPLISA